MHAPQQISIYLNNALRPTPQMAELDSDAALPEVIKEMPDRVSGHFVELEEPVARDIAAAWKRVMILNSTQVLYTFVFDPATGNFTAMKR